MKAKKDQFDALVIGGTGFIGEALVKELVSRGERVASVSRHLPDYQLSGVKYEALDISSDTERLAGLVAQGKDIFILIGQNYAGFDASQEEVIFRSLIRTIELSEGSKRIFFASSVLIYGNCRKVVSEEHSPEPIDSYSVFKKKCEDIVLGMSSRHQKVVLRLANVYGSEKNKGFIGLLLRKARQNDMMPIKVNGDGSQSRDYIFLDDVIQSLFAIRHQMPQTDIVNVATGQSHTLVEVIETVSAVLRRKIPYIVTGVALAEVDQSRIGNWKLVEQYHYTPQMTLEDGIRTTWERYREADSKQIALLGGEGFIGRNLSLHLSKKHRCYSIGRNRSMFDEGRADTFVQVDPYREKIPERCHIIVHLIDNKSVTLDTFLEEEKKLAENVSLHASCHLILFSSAVVYANPDSEYGRRKRMLEDFYSEYCQSRGIPLTIFRVFNTFGPFQMPYRQGSLVSNLIYNYLNGKKTDINDLYAQRDLIYSQDIAQCVEYAIQDTLVGVFDLGSGNLVSVKELIGILESDILHDTLGINNRRLKENILCQPAINTIMSDIKVTEIREGLSRTARFYKDNMHRVQPYVE